jgi:hypothetical protein
MSAIGHGWWLLLGERCKARGGECVHALEVTVWLSGGVARGCEGADVLVVVV